MDPLSIAGLALGAYPVLSHAFTQYKEGIEHFQNWRRFRSQFEAFSREVDAQNYFLENVIRDLIFGGPSPFPTKGTGISEDDVIECMKDQGDSIWQSGVLQDTVRLRLGDRYDWFLSTTQDIHDIQKELYSLLQISELESSERTAQWWEFQWRRIKETLFIERRDQKLKKLQDLIESLQMTLEMRDKRMNAGEIKSLSSFPQLVQNVRENAHSLYSALKQAWCCSCSVSHTTLLRLENRGSQTREDQDPGTRFDVLFIMPQNSTLEGDHLDGEVCVQPIEENAHIRQGVEVKVSDNIHAVPQPVKPPQLVDNNSASTVTSMEMGSATQATTKVERKRSFKSKLLGLRSKARLTFRSEGSPSQTKSTSSSETRSPSPSPSPSSLSVFSHVKTVKVRFAEAELSPSNTLFQTEKSIVKPEEQEQRITFSDPILDLCNVIRTPVVVNECFGYLVNDQKKRHELFAKDRSEIIRSKNLVCLREVLCGDRRQFSRQQRMMVATVLTSSLLELSQTQWLHPNWSKDDIYFERPNDGPEIIFRRPYIIQDFKSSVQNATRKPAELHSVKQDTLLKVFLQCLGIVLIELCFGMTIEQMQDTALVTPVNASDSKSYHAYCLSIANSFEWDVVNGEDPAFSDPITNCLHPPNMKMAREGRYDEVIDDIFITIIKPLHDETLSKWPGTFSETYV